MVKHAFKTEVSRLLHLIIHSLYSHPEIFLRELISNASDALDRLKYLTLTNDDFKGFAYIPKIEIGFDAKDKSFLWVSDSGIGMNEAELESNLGTIASSGTRRFLENLTEDDKKGLELIGQFGVGFYSSFMAAEKVEVLSRKAGEDKAYKWSSDGKGEFEITEAQRNMNGTTVTLHLNETGKEYADRWHIEGVIRKYSNHIPFPIFLHYKEDENKEEKVEQINSASALWKRPKAEIKDEEYREFYKTISHDTEDPLHYLHTQAEGSLEYATLFYIPKKAPFDLFFPGYMPGVKLYVRRVFITDDEKELLPSYLRFARGIIDSEDLPLNVSREMLQENRVLAAIRTATVKRILSELERLAQNTPETYEAFYKEYGILIKEGLYQDAANRDTLLELVRYKSSTEKGFTGLAAYKERMKSDQKAIYYLAGDREEALRASPLLESYSSRGLEVLFMDHQIDEIVIPFIGKYKDLPLKAINRSEAAEDIKTDDDRRKEKELKPLLGRIKKVLEGEVKDVRSSVRLSEAPCCIVADEEDPTIQMQHLFKAMGQKDIPEVKPILEINPGHPVVERMAALPDGELFEDACRLLLDQALLVEGGELKKPDLFAKRLNRILKQALPPAS